MAVAKKIRNKVYKILVQC